MNSCRLILDPPLKSTVNMAKDHAILHGLTLPGAVPTLRLYRWKHASVTLGYFQKIEECVNTGYCKKNGIPVTRRETAGGTIIHHMELTYSFTLPLNSGIVPVSVEDSFRAVISPVIESLRYLSIDASYRPVNDIVIGNKKISGSAQVRKKGILQQHGTVILDMNRELINSALIHDEKKLKTRGFSSVHESVTSVRDETGKEIDEKLIDDLIVVLIQNFSKTFSMDFSLSGLSEPETAVMETYSKKFASDLWNFKK